MLKKKLKKELLSQPVFQRMKFADIIHLWYLMLKIKKKIIHLLMKEMLLKCKATFI